MTLNKSVLFRLKDHIRKSCFVFQQGRELSSVCRCLKPLMKHAHCFFFITYSLTSLVFQGTADWFAIGVIEHYSVPKASIMRLIQTKQNGWVKLTT